MEFLSGTLLGFMLVLTRVGAFFAASPVFGWASIPPQTKTAMAMLLAIFFSAMTPYAPPAEQPDILQIILWTGAEAIYGVALGLVAYALFGVVRNAARIGEQQMGLDIASELDPLTEEQENTLAILIEMIFALLLFATSGHHILLKILARSYDHFGVGQIPSAAQLTESVLRSGSAMLMLSLQMAAPIIAVFMLIVVVMAIMAKIAPESNILFLSLPVRVGVGLFIFGLLTPYISNYLQTFVLWLDKLLVV
jgi:flagellar biosynthetic protein FliR